MNPNFPYDWFWLAEDGRLYASARQIIVDETDPDYLAWIEAGNTETVWPRAGGGEQTNDALQEVLTRYNLYLDPKAGLAAYAADKRWRVETGGIVAGGAPIATDDRSKTMIMGARIKADADPSYTVGWKTEAGFVTLTAAQIIAISDAVLAHVDTCFSAEAEVLDDIESGDIETISEIDAFAWPA